MRRRRRRRGRRRRRMRCVVTDLQRTRYITSLHPVCYYIAIQ